LPHAHPARFANDCGGQAVWSSRLAGALARIASCGCWRDDVSGAPGARFKLSAARRDSAPRPLMIVASLLKCPRLAAAARVRSHRGDGALSCVCDCSQTRRSPPLLGRVASCGSLARRSGAASGACPHEFCSNSSAVIAFAPTAQTSIWMSRPLQYRRRTCCLTKSGKGLQRAW